MTGIDYPTITVGGRELTVRFSLGVQMRLSKAGVDLRTPIKSDDPTYLFRRLQILQAAVADNYEAGSVPSVDVLAEQIGLAGWVAADSALYSAMGKASEELRKNLQVVAPPAESLAS